jgi:hypothetical protein
VSFNSLQDFRYRSLLLLWHSCKQIHINIKFTPLIIK